MNVKWSKRVSLRSVSSTNYPTLHHPLLWQRMKSYYLNSSPPHRVRKNHSQNLPPTKVGINAVTAKENEVSDRDWLEKRFQKMETKLQNEVKAQIASVQQMTSQPEQGQWSRKRTRRIQGSEEIEVDIEAPIIKDKVPMIGNRVQW